MKLYAPLAFQQAKIILSLYQSGKIIAVFPTRAPRKQNWVYLMESELTE